MKTSAERLKQVRMRMGMSQKDFARELGFTAVVLNRLENGNRQPSPEFLSALLNRYRVDLNSLVVGTKEGVGTVVPLYTADELFKSPEERLATQWLSSPATLDVHFAFRMNDDSMVPRLYPGDIVLVSEEPPDLGDLVLCHREAMAVTIRRLGRSRNEDTDLLVSENAVYGNVEYSADDVIGRVSGVIRHLPA